MNLTALSAVANSVRSLAIDAVEKAKSGHPGLPMGCAELGALVYGELLDHWPGDPDWINRDRFVLSAGHGCMLLYSLLHLSGYALSLDDIKNFRQLGSPHAGASRVGTDTGRGGHRRPAGTGPLQCGGHGDCGAHARGAVQYAVARRDRPLHVRAGQRRGHDGRRGVRGGLTCRPPGARQAHRLLRFQPHHDRRIDRACIL